MFCNNWGFNNFYINRCMPMGFNRFMGGCGCSSFNSGFRFGMMNSLFNFMMPQQNMNMFMPQQNMFFYQQSFAMPMFSPYNNIFALANQLMAPAFNAPAYNFALTPQASSSVNRNLTDEYNNNYSTQNTKTNNDFTLVTRKNKTNNKENQIIKKEDKNFKNTGKLDKNFLNRVKEVAKNLNCDYKDLLAVMNSESGLNPTAWNGTTAVGLIQFTDKSVAELNRVHGLNLTKEKIARMSPMEQLDITEKYLKIAKSYNFSSDARLSAGDLYAITFLPGRANREVLCTKGERGKNGQLLNYYESNPLDKDGDNRITKSDLEKHLAGKYVNESIFV